MRKPKQRFNGTEVTSIKAINRFFPYIMPRRCDSLVYFELKIDMENTLAYLEKINAGKEKAQHVKLYDLYLAAIHRIFLERPHLNRFIVGNRYYQRNEFLYYMTAKREFTDEAQERIVGLKLEAEDALDKVHTKARAIVKYAKTSDDKEDEDTVETLMKFPRWFIRWFAATMFKWDSNNRMPKSLSTTDGMHGSAFIANLGSFGMKTAPFHHLYEWGDISVFFNIGGLVKSAVVNQETGEIEVKTTTQMAITLDERIADGVYFKNSLDRFEKYIQNPELLEKLPEKLRDPYPGVIFPKKKKK